MYFSERFILNGQIDLSRNGINYPIIISVGIDCRTSSIAEMLGESWETDETTLTTSLFVIEGKRFSVHAIDFLLSPFNVIFMRPVRYGVPKVFLLFSPFCRQENASTCRNCFKRKKKHDTSKPEKTERVG